MICRGQFKSEGFGLATAIVPAAAEEPGGVTVTLGLGAAIAPDYFGAGTTSVGPTGVFAVRELVLPGGFGIGSDSALPTDPGFGARGAFRFVSTRAASENSELQGLDDIDFAVELGAGPVRRPRGGLRRTAPSWLSSAE